MSLSEYEQKRALNIERNNARLRTLGLISAREEQESNAAAWGLRVAEPKQRRTNEERSAQKRKTDAPQPSRQSKRLRGQPADDDGEGNAPAYTTRSQSNTTEELQ